MLDTGERAITALRQGMNACLLYGDGDDPIAAVAPYIAAGLAGGEQCVYVVGEHDPERIEQTLRAHGVDTRRERERGALVLVTEWQVSFPDGVFDPKAMIGFVRQAIADARSAGFSGLRVTAEMSWALGMGVGHNKLIHYEALGCRLYPHEPLVAVCLYNRDRFPAEVCRDALRTHPLVVQGDDLYENVFYELPDALVDGMAAAARVEWMLEQIRRVRTTERERSERLRAEAALRARDEFIAVAAHELRTPLAGLRGWTQLAARRLAQSGEAAGAGLDRSLGLIDRQALKLERMVEQLLDASRIQSGRLSLAPERCDVVALVREVMDEAQATTTEHAIRVEAPERLEAVVDPLRLEQVLRNLLENAIKYSPDGGEVAVAVAQPDDGRVLVAVRDHGLGIPPEQRERIFERFHQAHEGYSGLGVGLFICREIVRLHGGTLSLEAPSDGGSRFVMCLPSGGG